MKYYELDKEEKKILADYEHGKFKSIKSKKALDKYRAAAEATFAKRKVIIPMTFRDVQKLKEKAADIGIPYQKLASSVLHQYGNQ